MFRATFDIGLWFGVRVRHERVAGYVQWIGECCVLPCLVFQWYGPRYVDDRTLPDLLQEVRIRESLRGIAEAEAQIEAAGGDR